MNFATSLLLLVAFFSYVVAFPISRRNTAGRLGQFELYSSETSDNGHATNDQHALSGLLGEMFEAKLEMSRETKELESLVSTNSDMPVLGNDGIYRIVSQSQLENFKAANADKLVFLKFSSPICAACRMLKQKFQTLHRSPKFANKPVVFADIVISNNKKVADPFRDYITSQLQVQRIPSIHFYGNGGLVDEIFCDDKTGCSWPKIQQQMLDFVGKYYTPKTQNALSEGTNAVATIESENTSSSTTTKTKRKMMKQLLSLKWLG